MWRGKFAIWTSSLGDLNHQELQLQGERERDEKHYLLLSINLQIWQGTNDVVIITAVNLYLNITTSFSYKISSFKLKFIHWLINQSCWYHKFCLSQKLKLVYTGPIGSLKWAHLFLITLTWVGQFHRCHNLLFDDVSVSSILNSCCF